MYCIVVGSRMHCSRRLILQTLVFSHSYFHHQVSPSETLVVKGGTTWARKGRWILPENARLPRNIQGSFACRKSTTWDKRLYFYFRRKACWGFEPANLGIKGQHATCRPPKPLISTVKYGFSEGSLCLHLQGHSMYFPILGLVPGKWRHRVLWKRPEAHPRAMLLGLQPPQI